MEDIDELNDEGILFKYCEIAFLGRYMKIIKKRTAQNWLTDEILRVMTKWTENDLPRNISSRYKILDPQTLGARNLARVVAKTRPEAGDIYLVIVNVYDEHWLFYSFTLGHEAVRCIWNSYPAVGPSPEVAASVEEFHRLCQVTINCEIVEETVNLPVPLQPNTVDCGFYCVLFLKYILLEEDDCKVRDRSNLFNHSDVEDYRWRFGIWVEWMYKQNTIYRVSLDLHCIQCQELVDVTRPESKIMNCRRGYGLGHRGITHQSCSARFRCPACESKEVEYTSFRRFQEIERLETEGYSHSIHLRIDNIFIMEELHSCPATYSTFQTRQVVHTLREIYIDYFAAKKKILIDENWTFKLHIQISSLLEVSFLKQHAICSIREGDSCANFMPKHLLNLFLPILKFLSALTTAPTMIDCLVNRGEDPTPEGCRCGDAANGSWGMNQTVNLVFPDEDSARRQTKDVGERFRQVLNSDSRPGSWGRKRKARS